MNKFPTGKLTSRSNDTVAERRYSGDFGQPSGFGSVLEVRINKSGAVAFLLHYLAFDGNPMMWCVNLTNEQRLNLSEFLSTKTFEPKLWEDMGKEDE